MITTIDRAGRIVVPKALRDAMGLSEGRRVDIHFADGRLEVELVPARTHLETVAGELPRIVADEDLPPLASPAIRDTLEAIRR